MGLKRNERAMSEKMHDLKKKITLLKPWNIQGKTEDRMKAVWFFFFSEFSITFSPENPGLACILKKQALGKKNNSKEYFQPG